MKENHPMMCNVNDSCLLILDIQERLAEAMPIKVIKRLERNTMAFLQAAELLSVPVFITEQYPEGLGSFLPELVQKFPAGCKRFTKTSFSCAGAEGFLDSLRECGRSR